MSNEDSSLTTQCLAFCQALASQGTAFNISLTVGSSFSFSLDTREKTPSAKERTTSAKAEVRKKKKPSPSSLRRNAERREEFLRKKPDVKTQKSADPAVKPTVEKPTVPRLEFKCGQCEYVNASEKGLTQHTRMKHRISQLDGFDDDLQSDERGTQTDNYLEIVLTGKPGKETDDWETGGWSGLQDEIFWELPDGYKTEQEGSSRVVREETYYKIFKLKYRKR
jgi:hypothetical protein